MDNHAIYIFAESQEGLVAQIEEADCQQFSVESVISRFEFTDSRIIYVVAPLTIDCVNITPAPVVNGVLVCIYYYAETTELPLIVEKMKHNPSEKEKRRLVLLSPWEDLFTKLSNRFYNATHKKCKSADMSVVKWYAEKISRENLITKLFKERIGSVVYIGHGRSRGWTGYMGIRWKHIAEQECHTPIDTIFSMTCDTLKKERDVPFGVNWVLSGKARAFFGSIEAVKIDSLTRICEIMTERLDSDSIKVRDFLLDVDQTIKSTNDQSVIDCWNTFRLIGNPNCYV